MIQERLIASLSGFFGGLALLLAAMGLYGVMSYSVVRRRNEIGIRMALGAAPARVMRMVLSHVAGLTVLGVLLGIGIAAGAARFINSLLYGLVGHDATMIAIAGATLGLAGAVAGYLPARRAARVDPMTALRDS
jgi:ABC-type antimicrobial peptide transport system permease subunit